MQKFFVEIPKEVPSASEQHMHCSCSHIKESDKDCLANLLTFIEIMDDASHLHAGEGGRRRSFPKFY